MKTYFYNGHIIDAVAEDHVFDAMYVEDQKIVSVGNHEVLKNQIPQDATWEDLKGRYVIPGLIDCHAHMLMTSTSVEKMLMTYRSLGLFRGIRNLENTLKMGITTVRDCGGCDPGIRIAIEEGIIRGPRLRTCGILTPTGGHNETYFPIGYSLDIEPGNTDSVYDGVEGVTVGTRTRIRQGYDFVKITATGGINDPQTEPFAPEYTLDEIKKIVEISKMRGKDIVVAHCHGGEAVRLCLEGGIRSIEHGTWIDDECMAMMVEEDAYYVPTLSITHFMEEQQKEMELPAYTIEKHNRTKGIALETFHRALKYGVKICMGTDAASELMHGQNAMELCLMVENGMDPYDALLTGTRNAAELLQLSHEIGTLESGKLADFVILEKDPLKDFHILLDPAMITAVYKEGGKVNRE